MTALQWWGLFLGVPPVMLAMAAITAWLFKEKIAGVVFWAFEEYPRQAPTVSLQQSIAAQNAAIARHDQEFEKLRAMIHEELKPLGDLGKGINELRSTLQLVGVEIKRHADAVERIPNLATAIEVLKARVDTPPPHRRKP